MTQNTLEKEFSGKLPSFTISINNLAMINQQLGHINQQLGNDIHILRMYVSTTHLYHGYDQHLGVSVQIQSVDVEPVLSSWFERQQPLLKQSCTSNKKSTHLTSSSYPPTIGVSDVQGPPNSLTIKLLPTQHPKPFWILVLDYVFGNSGTTQKKTKKCQSWNAEYLFMIRFSRRYDVHAYRRISDVIYKYQVTKWIFWCMKQLHQPKFLHHFDFAKIQDISAYNENMTSQCRYIMVSIYKYIYIYITPPSQVAHLHCNRCFLSITATTKA